MSATFHGQSQNEKQAGVRRTRRLWRDLSDCKGRLLRKRLVVKAETDSDTPKRDVGQLTNRQRSLRQQHEFTGKRRQWRKTRTLHQLSQATNRRPQGQSPTEVHDERNELKQQMESLLHSTTFQPKGQSVSKHRLIRFCHGWSEDRSQT
jgi:hypothetical protein